MCISYEKNVKKKSGEPSKSSYFYNTIVTDLNKQFEVSENPGFAGLLHWFSTNRDISIGTYAKRQKVARKLRSRSRSLGIKPPHSDRSILLEMKSPSQTSERGLSGNHSEVGEFSKTDFLNFINGALILKFRTMFIIIKILFLL